MTQEESNTLPTAADMATYRGTGRATSAHAEGRGAGDGGVSAMAAMGGNEMGQEDV